jgi:dihydropteroate synthase
VNCPFSPRVIYSIPLPGRDPLQLGARTLVMGILNVTPDSFAETSSKLDPVRAADLAFQMEADGADLIDIGGESTRPGAEPVPAQVECDRVLPVIEALASRLRVPMSIDTSKAGVARAGLAAGAAIVNDVTALRADAALARTVADAGAALILMHSRGNPRTMGSEAVYEDLIAEVIAELRAGIGRAVAAGLPLSSVIVDPGIGFAKQPAHSYGVLAHIPAIAAAIDRPLLVGPSRKSFMRAATGDRPAAERDWGTAAAVTAAVLGGAHIVRVHAVKEMVQVVRVAEEVRTAG